MEILFVIEKAFYQDNGTYSCEAKNSSDNDWTSASVELVLLGKFYVHYVLSLHECENT